MTTDTTSTFASLPLSAPLHSTLAGLGYLTPTPVQAQSIPLLLSGSDLIAQAQTGTGKTAAFALPIVEQIDITLKAPQALVIAPTRELAIQVAQAFQGYAGHLKGFQVSPIYGGQDYKTQLKALKRGAHVVVGTPGRLMDHMRRGTLSCDTLQHVVLDEADEMLKMGFISDIEWILEQIPHAHQTALFSATMPAPIQKIAKRYLKDAAKVQIKIKKNAINPIEQFYTKVTRKNKLGILLRFLESEDRQASIIFTRTKSMAAELAEILQARGYAAAALHGDMNQAQRKHSLDKIKNSVLDIVVATDVAARGIDVDRITHVVNFDMPFDAESYIHRIGRTGRAGREGRALLLVGSREERMLKAIEQATGSPLASLAPPSNEELEALRNQQLVETITNIIRKSKQLGPFQALVSKMTEEQGCKDGDVAAALMYLMQQKNSIPTDEQLPLSSASEPEPRQKRRAKPSRHKPTSKPRSAGSRHKGKHHESGFKHRKTKGKKRIKA